MKPTTLEVIRRTREYLDYIEEHINNVHRAFAEISAACHDMPFIYDDFKYEILRSQVEQHDISKLSKGEFCQYRQYFYTCEGEEKPKEINEAIQHHYDHNDHHWQTICMKPYTNPIEMEIDIAHMVIDWMAMGYKFGDTAKSYYEANKDGIRLPEPAVAILNQIFERLYP